jgi:DNA-binding NtrC family response regulator
MDAWSKSMLSLAELLPTVAATDLPVLIVGEPGVGHSATAEVLHRLSKRRGALVYRAASSLVDGGVAALDEAEYGTLVIRDVEDLPPTAQATLLERLSNPTPDSAVIVATTCCDLRVEVTARRMHPGLYYSLSSLIVSAPPLRDRPIELHRLILDAMASAAGALRIAPHPLAPNVLQALETHPWPGNLDELHSVAGRLASLPRPPAAEDVQEAIDDQEAGHKAPLVTRTLAKVIDDAIADAVAQCDGHVKRAAKALGVSKATIYRRAQSGRSV